MPELNSNKSVTTMVDVKGNNGKAVRIKITTQLLIVVALAVVVVGAIKTFGTADWHASATLEDHGQTAAVAKAAKVKPAKVKSANVADIAVAKEPDKNMIQFVFSSLDGEEGSEGA